jgi:RimJ/RimL family protein N-acetyltransferase
LAVRDDSLVDASGRSARRTPSGLQNARAVQETRDLLVLGDDHPHEVLGALVPRHILQAELRLVIVGDDRATRPHRRDRPRHMTQHVTLETAFLGLRELGDDDAPAVHVYASDTEVVRYLDWGPNTPEDTARFLATAHAARDAVPRTAYHLAIILKTTGRLVGGRRIETLLAFGFGRLALRRIWATCDVENRASARVLEKLGMRREGHLRHNVRRNGEWRDSHLYAILEPEWRDGSRRT